jgi:hypothetical protein
MVSVYSDIYGGMLAHIPYTPLRYTRDGAARVNAPNQKNCERGI